MAGSFVAAFLAWNLDNDIKFRSGAYSSSLPAARWLLTISGEKPKTTKS